MIKNGAKVYRMEDARVPYLVNGNQWIGYDDPQSLREKVSNSCLKFSKIGKLNPVHFTFIAD